MTYVPSGKSGKNHQLHAKSANLLNFQFNAK